MAPEIIVIPFHGQGHIFPCIELCNQLAIRDFKITLILPSHLSSSITTVDHHPLVQIADIPFSSPPPPPPSENTTGNSDHPFPDTQLNPFSQLLSQRLASLNPPVCLIVDVMMGWIQDTCRKSGIPIISFFTSGACSAAMEYAIWKIQPENLKPGEILSLPGLPESMILTSSDLTHNEPPPPHHDHGGGAHHPPPPPRNHHTRGPPPPHQQEAGNRRPCLPGLPESMILTSSDLTHNEPPLPHHDHGGGAHHPPPPPRNHHTRGPPPPHQQEAGNRRPCLPESMILTASDLTHNEPPLPHHDHGGGAHHPPPPPRNHHTRGPPPPHQQEAGNRRPCLPGLPESMILTSSDLTHNEPPPPHHDHGGGAHHPPPPPRNHHTRGPPPPHQQGARNRRPWQPGWVSDTEDSIALLMNTCSDLEGPFLDYVSKETKKPVWGVGPLLPAQFWKSVDFLVHDGEVRAKKQSNVSDEQVQDWLDSKPRRSVIYVAFGSEVGPTVDELAELANGLEESNLPFIWAIQNGAGRNGPPGPPPGHPVGDGTPGPPPGSDSGGFFPDGLESRVKGRGLVIRGWAPQLLILSHPSVAGFLSHCGWNSILEALGRGVPLLAWPIRGDQHYNAKLVVSHLKVGLMLRKREGAVNKSDIVEGIEKLIGEAEIKKRAGNVRSIFAAGFPASSLLSLDSFRDFSLRIGK